MANTKTFKQRKKDMILFLSVFSVVPIWLGVVFAPYSNNGFVKMIISAPNIDFFSFKWCGMNTVKTVGLFFLIYLVAAVLYFTSMKNTRRGEEYGGLHWGDPRDITNKYADKSRLIVTKEEAISNNMHIIRKVEENKLFSTFDICYLMVISLISIGCSLIHNSKEN